MGNRRTEATCNVELGNICLSVCQYAKAKIYYEKALEIAMEISGTNKEAMQYVELGKVSFEVFGR